MRRLGAVMLLTTGLGLAAAGCGDDAPLCCVEIDPGEPIQALTCESEAAVIECMGYNFSDCYYDSARNDQCN